MEMWKIGLKRKKYTIAEMKKERQRHRLITDIQLPGNSDISMMHGVMSVMV